MVTNPVIVIGNDTFTASIVGKDLFLNVTTNGAVPEPASLLMLGLGMLGVGAYVARRSRAAGR
jgi:hypothetical protein